MILTQTNPALALAADLMQTLPNQVTTSIPDRDGYESKVLNVTIQQHPISGALTIGIRPGSPLESPVHFDTLQTLAQRHGATCVLPPRSPVGAEIDLPGTPTTKPVPEPKSKPKRKPIK